MCAFKYRSTACPGEHLLGGCRETARPGLTTPTAPARSSETLTKLSEARETELKRKGRRGFS